MKCEICGTEVDDIDAPTFHESIGRDGEIHQVSEEESLVLGIVYRMDRNMIAPSCKKCNSWIRLPV